MKFATASILFSLVAFVAAWALRESPSSLALPLYVFLSIVDVVLFLLGKKDAAAALDMASAEWEIAELKALMGLLVALFVLSIIALGYLIVVYAAPSVFTARSSLGF